MHLFRLLENLAVRKMKFDLRTFAEEVREPKYKIQIFTSNETISIKKTAKSFDVTVPQKQDLNFGMVCI